MIFDQSEFEIRCEWGARGVEQLAPISDVIIIVDILSFSTCVEIATSRGAIVFPYQWKDETAEKFAAPMGAELAVPRAEQHVASPYSLSPQSLNHISQGTRLVLPSPNGSTLSLMTGNTPTLAGCLRNCRAVAQAALSYGHRIAVIPAGEKWHDGSLRPAVEDWIGAGAILSHLKGHGSPEAASAISAYHQAVPNLNLLLRQCSSGKELISKGFQSDVDLASELNVNEGVPKLHDRAYIHHSF
jgi:2-phosphosulfolactate phosphatase